MKVALLCSAKPQLVPPDAPWLRKIRQITRWLARDGHTLCGSIGTLPYELVAIEANRHGVPEEIWLEGDHQRRLLAALSLPETAVYGPPAEERWTPLARDEALIRAADLVIAVSIRKGGRLERLLHAHQQREGNVRVAPLLPGERDAGGNQRMLERGVPVWQRELDSTMELEPPSVADAPGLSSPHGSQASREASPLAPFVLEDLPPRWRDAPLAGPTLAHFTRACAGPWPGQSRRDYLLDLLDGGSSARRDVLATLAHILHEKRVRGSSRLIRGGRAMVSLTAVPVCQVAALSTFRRHLARWDFLPYGLVFRQDALEALGAFPVIYAPENSFSTLDPKWHAWFQPHEPQTLDTRVEQEWRLSGDLDLSLLRWDDVRWVLPDDLSL